MRKLEMSALGAAGLVAAMLTSAGCSKTDKPGEPDPATATTSSASAAPARPARPAPAEARVSHIAPSGPMLAIQAGKGLGPIFLGATIPTIERQMALPCDEKTADVCRYFTRAAEFFLKDGKLVRIHVQRMDRPAGKDARGVERRFGIFHGAIPPDIKLGMLPWAVHQYLGKPRALDKVADGGDNHTVYVEHYPGMDLEFDELGPNRVVLGGVWIPAAPPK